MRPLASLCALAIAVLPLSAQAAKGGAKAAARPECPDERLDAFYIGHSLAYQIPDVVAGLFAARKDDAGQYEFRYREQYIPGASLGSQFAYAERPVDQRREMDPNHQGVWSDEFAKGGWDALVLIDSVPRSEQDLPDTLDHATRFAQALAVKSPKAFVYIYEPWNCIHSGTERSCEWDRSPAMKLLWRQRLVADAPMWNKLVDDLRKAQPKTRFALIPAGRALGMAWDAADAGTIDGLPSGKDFFSDDIHLTPYGYYFIGLVHYAALSGQSPIGLPTDIADRWDRRFFDAPDHHGKNWKGPSPSATKRLQEIAWAAVQGKPDPGIGKGAKTKKAAGGGK